MPFKARIESEQPNADINKFIGQIDIEFGKESMKMALNHKNLLLRGTKVKNTEWIVGMTVYTGSNTKIMMNGTSATSKISRMERKANNIILVVLLFEVLCCGISAVYCYVECLNYYSFVLMIAQRSYVNCS